MRLKKEQVEAVVIEAHGGDQGKFALLSGDSGRQGPQCPVQVSYRQRLLGLA